MTLFRLQQLLPPYWRYTVLQQCIVVNMRILANCFSWNLHASRNARSANNVGVIIFIFCILTHFLSTGCIPTNMAALFYAQSMTSVHIMYTISVISSRCVLVCCCDWFLVLRYTVSRRANRDTLENKCQTPPKRQTDRHQDRIWWISALNVTSGGNNFNYFPENQLTKFRVFIGWSRIFNRLPWMSMKRRASFPVYDGRPRQTQRTKRQTDKQTCLFVLLSLRWSLTVRNFLTLLLTGRACAVCCTQFVRVHHALCSRPVCRSRVSLWPFGWCSVQDHRGRVQGARSSPHCAVWQWQSIAVQIRVHNN